MALFMCPSAMSSAQSTAHEKGRTLVVVLPSGLDGEPVAVPPLVRPLRRLPRRLPPVTCSRRRRADVPPLSHLAAHRQPFVAGASDPGRCLQCRSGPVMGSRPRSAIRERFGRRWVEVRSDGCQSPGLIAHWARHIYRPCCGGQSPRLWKAAGDPRSILGPSAPGPRHSSKRLFFVQHLHVCRY